MSSAPPPAETSLAEAHRLALAKLREMGMEIAGRLHAQSQEPDADVGEMATKFARVARAVRQTIALEARLADESRRRAEALAAQNRSEGQDPTMTPLLRALSQDWVSRAEARQRTAENKLEAVTLVRRAAARVPGLDREAFYERLDDRLDADPYDKAFDPAKDLTETIAGICSDLGLDPDWGGLSELDWRQISLETRSALTGAPISSLPAPLHQRRPPHSFERRMPQPPWWRLPPDERPNFPSLSSGP